MHEGGDWPTWNWSTWTGVMRQAFGEWKFDAETGTGSWPLYAEQDAEQDAEVSPTIVFAQPSTNAIDRPPLRWTLAELDAFHQYVGLGDQWRSSDRRAEVAALEVDGVPGRCAVEFTVAAYDALGEGPKAQRWVYVCGRPPGHGGLHESDDHGDRFSWPGSLAAGDSFVFELPPVVLREVGAEDTKPEEVSGAGYSRKQITWSAASAGPNTARAILTFLGEAEDEPVDEDHDCMDDYEARLAVSKAIGNIHVGGGTWQWSVLLDQIREIRISANTRADRAARAELVVDEFATAIVHTAEYLNRGTLPAKRGWSWYDVLMAHRPELVVPFRDEQAKYDAAPAPVDNPVPGITRAVESHEQRLLGQAGEEAADGRLLVAVRCPHKTGLAWFDREADVYAQLPCPCNDRSELVAVVHGVDDLADWDDQRQRMAHRNPSDSLAPWNLRKALADALGSRPGDVMPQLAELLAHVSRLAQQAYGPGSGPLAPPKVSTMPVDVVAGINDPYPAGQVITIGVAPRRRWWHRTPRGIRCGMPEPRLVTRPIPGVTPPARACELEAGHRGDHRAGETTWQLRPALGLEQ